MEEAKFPSRASSLRSKKRGAYIRPRSLIVAATRFPEDGESQS